MVPDILYDQALAFKKTKLWMKLYDTQLFAVRHSDGKLGYCCIMGRMGEHLALADYPGDEGLEAYRRMGIDRDGMDLFENHETAMSQDCIMVSFQNKGELRKREVAEVTAYQTARGLALRGKKAYPQFERFRPHYYPWYLDEEKDQVYLQEALEAALAVSERLTLTAPEAIGFTEGPPFDRSIPLLEKENGAFVWKTAELGAPREIAYATPQITDDILLAKLSKCKKRGKVWACDIFMHMDPMSDEAQGEEGIEDPINAPYFPYLLLITDAESGIVLGVQMAKELDDTTEFFRCLADTALSAGKPTRILVTNERARAFFENLAPLLGAELVMYEHVPALTEAKQSLAERLGDQAPVDEEDIDNMMEMLSNPQAYADMPDEVLVMLKQVAQEGALPDEVVRLMKRECKKRGM